MNIAFHYYAIKALCVTAGFSNEDAQRIAEYSQFIDDYSGSDIIVTNYAPEEAVTKGITKKKGDTEYQTQQVTTGFTDNFIETARNIREVTQNRMLIPFHFILPNQLNEGNYSQASVPAHVGDKQIISQMLREACLKVKQAEKDSAAYLRGLMQLGMVLHVFCDTHAHQGFSGHHQDSNNQYIVQVHRQYAGNSIRDETDKYSKYGWLAYKSLPAVGHCPAGHVPDDTYLLSITKHEKNSYVTVDNMSRFIALSEELLPVLCDASGKSSVPFASVAGRMREGLLADNDDPKLLLSGWENAFRGMGISFNYNRLDILRRLIPSTKSEVDLSDTPWLESEAHEATLEGMLLKSPNDPPISLTAQASVEFFDFTIEAYEMRQKAVDSRFL